MKSKTFYVLLIIIAIFAALTLSSCSTSMCSSYGYGKQGSNKKSFNRITKASHKTKAQYTARYTK